MSTQNDFDRALTAVNAAEALLTTANELLKRNMETDHFLYQAVLVSLVRTRKARDLFEQDMYASIPGDGLRVIFSAQDNTMVVEASDLGLRPTQWPLVIDITGPHGSIKRFYRYMGLENGRSGYQYRSLGDSLKLEVLND